MSVSVRLDAETGRLLNGLAKTRGQTKSSVVREAIAALAQREAGIKDARTPYRMIAHLIGCADSGGAALSKKTGEKFRALLRGDLGRVSRS